MAENLESLSPEDQAALAQLMRQRQFAQLLQQRSMQNSPTEMVSGHAIKQSPLGVLVRGASGYFGSKMQDTADTQQAQIMGRGADRQQQELTELLADPKKGMARALASRIPAVRNAAAALQKREDEKLGKWAQMAAGRDAGFAANNFRDQTMPDVPAAAAPTVEQGVGPDGKPVGFLQNTGEGGRLSGTPLPAGMKVEVNTGNKGASAAAEAIGKDVPDTLKGAVSGAQKALASIQSADRILDLINKPEVITGFGADPRAAMASLGSFLGFTGPDAAAQTQALMAEMATQTLANVKKLPGAITEKERPFLELASAGKLSFDPATIARLAHIAKITGHNELMQSRTQYMGAVGVPGAEAGAAMYPFPRIGEYSMDPNVSQEIGEGSNFWKYREGPAPGTVPQKPGAAPTNDAAKAARILELKKKLGLPQ